MLRACKGRAANLRACVYLRIWYRKAIPPKSFQSLPYGQQPLNKVANFFPSWCLRQSHWIILNSRSKSNYIIVIMEQICNDHLHYSFLIDSMIVWPFPWIGFFHHFCRVSTPVILIRPWVNRGKQWSVPNLNYPPLTISFFDGFAGEVGNLRTDFQAYRCQMGTPWIISLYPNFISHNSENYICWWKKSGDHHLGCILMYTTRGKQWDKLPTSTG